MIRSLYEVRRTYDALRLRYFHVDPRPYPVHDLPLAKELRWYWLPANSDALGMTTFDEEGDPEDVGLHTMLRPSPRLLRQTLLHEMTHMRLGPGSSCGGWSHAWAGPRIPRASAWYQETVRLVELRALHF